MSIMFSFHRAYVEQQVVTYETINFILKYDIHTHKINISVSNMLKPELLKIWYRRLCKLNEYVIKILRTHI